MGPQGVDGGESLGGAIITFPLPCFLYKDISAPVLGRRGGGELVSSGCASRADCGLTPVPIKVARFGASKWVEG